MATKTILLAVAEPSTLVDIGQALGAGWEATSVTSQADALAQLDQHSFEALLVDFNLGTPDASELMNQALQKRPELPRFLLAYEADLALVAAKVLGSPQILPKPIEAASLKSRIENAGSEGGSGAEEPTTAAPSAVPPVYAEVAKAFEDPAVTPDQVAEIIARDSTLSAEVMTLAKSVTRGGGTIQQVSAAVTTLGLGTVKAVVMALRFLAEHSHRKPGYMSFDQLWQHSVSVAQIAHDLMLFETKDRQLALEALTAGLLHDLGKVVLVANFDDLYARVHSLVRKQPVSLWDVEKEMFGASHGEIGACLVGMWNMPGPVVEAVALHHEPPVGEQDHFTPLAAVHVANVLEHELRPGDECRVAPIINTPFLNELGLLGRLPIWRAAIANRRSAHPKPDAEILQTEPEQTAGIQETTDRSPMTNRHPRLAGRTRTASFGAAGKEPAAPFVATMQPRQKIWLYAGIGGALLLLILVWRGSQFTPDTPDTVYALSPAANPAQVSVTPAPVPEAADEPKPEAKPASAVADQPAVAAPANASAPGTNVVTVSSRASAVAVEPAKPVTPPVATNVPVVRVAPPAPAPREYRLQGIIYSASRPSAIINGKTVYVGDRVDGATVIQIEQTEVTLQVNGKRKTYDLH